MYLPNRLSTAAWLGSTMYRPIRPERARTTSTSDADDQQRRGGVPWRDAVEEQPDGDERDDQQDQQDGMPGRERSGFSFMAVLLVLRMDREM